MRNKSPQARDTPSAGEEADRNGRLDNWNSDSDHTSLSNIGKGLRAVYMGVPREPLPERVVGLLKKIHNRNDR